MTFRTIAMLWVALTPVWAGCLPVMGDRILAADMAQAVPGFAGIAPDVFLGFAPAPGGRRIYNSPELARLARRYGLSLEPGVEACFVRPVETLTPERVMAALASTLPAARIEVVDFSRQPVPAGALRFPVAGLQTDPSSHAPLLWRGQVCAAGRDDFPVWVKVRLKVSGKRVVAREWLAAGKPIDLAQIREEPYEGTPGLPELSQVVGWIARRPIPAGAVIERQWLDEPADVMRGERVRLEIRSGQAVVWMDGEAQASGRRGELIGIRNLSNGRILRATVIGRDSALLLAGPASGRPEEEGNR